MVVSDEMQNILSERMLVVSSPIFNRKSGSKINYDLEIPFKQSCALRTTLCEGDKAIALCIHGFEILLIHIL